MLNLAISSGDPAGVGPEIVVKALADPSVRRLARWFVLGESWILEQASPSTTWEPDAILPLDSQGSSASGAGEVIVLEPNAVEKANFRLGEVNGNCGTASLQYVAAATKLCLADRAAAIVTAPINKEAVSQSGGYFTGHTEYIAELCGVDESRMLLVNDKMRVVHVTTHCALAEASNVDIQRVLVTLRLGDLAMRRLGWRRPRLAVCGLNPHAGENGLFGDQETRVIAPAIAAAREEGIDCVGPFPADTLFLQAYRGKYDMVVAMYHDQGHVPMKLLDFEHTVNVSLGLPIIRTSVDHGTAFDIAGKDVADPEDMKTAMRLAVRLAAARAAEQNETTESTSIT